MSRRAVAGMAPVAGGGVATPYYWFINGRTTADVRVDPKDVGIPGLQQTPGADVPLTTLDGLTTESVRKDAVGGDIKNFNSTGTDERLGRYSYAEGGAGTHFDGWDSIPLPPGDYIVNSAHGCARTDGSDAVAELWEGTGNVTDGDRTQVFSRREFAVGADLTLGAVCDIQCDATYTFDQWLALDLVARGESVTVTDRGSAAANGIRYYMNKADAVIANNFIRLSYIRIWQVT